MNTHALMYPLCAALGLPIVHAGPGYDVLDLEAKLGPGRFAALMKTVKEVFCANHRAYPQDHELAGCEVHCVYARDLETFLSEEAR